LPFRTFEIQHIPKFGSANIINYYLLKGFETKFSNKFNIFLNTSKYKVKINSRTIPQITNRLAQNVGINCPNMFLFGE